MWYLTIIMHYILPKLYRFCVRVSLPDDHMVLEGEDFKGSAPKQLTVRTATADQLESVDSAAVRLPQSLIKEVTVGTARSMASEAVRAANLRKVKDETGLLALTVCLKVVLFFK